jgi:hypothetical protein
MKHNSTKLRNLYVISFVSFLRFVVTCYLHCP